MTSATTRGIEGYRRASSPGYPAGAGRRHLVGPPGGVVPRRSAGAGFADFRPSGLPTTGRAVRSLDLSSAAAADRSSQAVRELSVADSDPVNVGLSGGGVSFGASLDANGSVGPASLADDPERCEPIQIEGDP